MAMQVAGLDDVNISIHAPLAGSDRRNSRFGGKCKHFNPRSPRGERPADSICKSYGGDISIHAPLAGSDGYLSGPITGLEISIHAPLAGSDSDRERFPAL